MDYDRNEVRQQRRLLHEYLTGRTPNTIALDDDIRIGSRDANLAFLLYELAAQPDARVPADLRRVLHLSEGSTYETAIEKLQQRYARIEEQLDISSCGFCSARPVKLVRAWGLTLNLCIPHYPEARLAHVPSEGGSIEGPCSLCGNSLAYDRLFFCGESIAVCSQHLHALQQKVHQKH